MDDKKVSGALSLIDELRSDAKLGKSKHFNASRRKLQWHNTLGIPVIVINVFIGTVIVALMSGDASNTPLSIVSAILAFLAACLSALQTFFNFQRAAEGHSAIGNRYLNISRQCKKVIRKNQDIPFGPEKIWKKAGSIQERYLSINEAAEAFPTNDRDLKKAKSVVEVTPFKIDASSNKQ